MATDLIPVTIFGGFLGSGKTTIILNSLKQFETQVNFALIKNEYGDVNVDAQLMRESNLAVKEVVNGCLCCVLIGSLNEAVDELVNREKPPERIIIESSGNALPFPIVMELKRNKRVYVDGVVIVVDCVNFDVIKDKSVVVREQAKYTDLIVFNKTGMVDEDKLYHVKEEVNDLNPDTVKVETADGTVKPEVLFGIDHDMGRWEGMISERQGEKHEHDEGSCSFGWESQKVLQVQKVQEVLEACRPGSFYRIKGIVQTEKGWRLVNGVFGRLEWREIGEPREKVSRIVFIGKDILQWEGQVKDYLEKAVV